MRQRSAGVWWLHPAFVFAAAGIAIGIAAYIIPESTYRIYWRTPKFFDEHALRITLLSVLVFVVGSFCGTRLGSSASGARRAHGGDEIPSKLIFLLFRISFYLCLAGYAFSS